MTADAAHAFTLVAGNGSCLAFEDVSTILALLKEVRGVSRIPRLPKLSMSSEYLFLSRLWR
jgi:2-polyprenyl-6-methoxyphenol hydroxylase-like FAD-dependent oxidoreductase